MSNNVNGESLPENSPSTTQNKEKSQGKPWKSYFSWTHTARVRSLFISLIILSVVSLISVFGYIILVESQEEYLHEKNYRVLNQIAQNVILRNASYAQTAKNVDRVEYVELIRKKDSLREFLNRYAPPFQIDTLPLKKESLENTYENKVFYRNRAWYLRYDTLQYKSENEVKSLNINVLARDFFGNIWREDTYDEFYVFLKERMPTGKVSAEKDSRTPRDSMRERLVFESNPGSFLADYLEDHFFQMDTSEVLRVKQLDEKERYYIQGLPYIFYFKNISFQQNEWILCGIIEKDHFEASSRKFSPMVVIVLSLAILIFLLILPILKLRLMSKNERLKVSDIFYALSSAMLNTAIVTIILFDAHHVLNDQTRIKNHLTSLSHSIKDEFIEECRGMIAQLYHADSLQENGMFSTDSCAKVSIINSLIHPKQVPSTDLSYPFFRSIYWANSQGKILREWSSNIEKTHFSPINISKREYFQRISNDQGWEIPSQRKRELKSLEEKPSRTGEIDTTRTTLQDYSACAECAGSFYLESLLTLSTGENLALLAIPSHSTIKSKPPCPSGEASIVFMTANLYSVMQTVVPKGFGYCVIDAEGKVLFHHDKGKNLQENFFNETTNKALQAAVGVRGHKFDTGKYLGKDHSFYVQPLGELPLFLVTFFDRSNYRSFHSQVFTLSLLFFLITYIVSLILIGMIVFRGSGKEIHSAYNTQFRGKFIFDWLRPRDSFKGKYRYLALLNLIILLLTIEFTLPYKVEAIEVISLISLSYIYVFINAFIRLSVNYSGRYEIRENAMILILVIILWGLITTFTWYILPEERSKLFRFQGILILISLLFNLRSIANNVSWLKGVLQNEKLPKLSFPKLKNTQFVRNLRSVTPTPYNFFLYTWLLVISVFPAIKLYEISYNREWKLQTKLTQVYFLQDFWERKSHIELEYTHLKPSDSSKSAQKESWLTQLTLDKGVYKGAYKKPLHKFSKISKDSVAEEPKESITPLNYLDSVLYTFRPPFDPLVRSSGILFQKSTPDDFYYWKENASDSTITLINNKSLEAEEADKIIALQSIWPSIKIFEAGLIPWLFWLIFLIVLVVFYKVVVFTANRVTGQSVLQLPIYNPPEVTKPGFVRTFLKKTQENIFLIIPPRTIEGDYKRLVLEKSGLDENEVKGNSCLFLDMRKLIEGSEADWKKELAGVMKLESPIIALDFFEVCSELSKLKSIELRLGKYKIIEDLLECGKTIFIISTMEPLQMQDIFKWNYLKYQTDESDEIAAEDISKIRQENFRWSQLLRTFTKVYYPLQKCQVCYSAQETYNFLSSGEKLLIIPFSNQKNFESAVNNTDLDKDKKEEFKGLANSVNNIGDYVTYYCPLFPTYPLEAELSKSEIGKVRNSLKNCLKRLVAKTRNSGRSTPNVSFISNISHMGILQLYTEYLIPYYQKNDASKVRSLEEEQESWANLFDRFSKAVLVIDDTYTNSKEELVRNRVHRECIHGNFMQGIQEDLIIQQIKQIQSEEEEQRILDPDYGEKNKLKDDYRRIKDRVLEETEIRAELYYHALWTSCTVEEKYLIYDLAEDGLINPRNRDGIASLIRKGIIVKQDGRLRIFNNSFRNFVLTVIKPQDALQFEARLRRLGTWNWIRVPLTLTVLAIALFLVWTQHDLVNQSIAFVTGLLAIFQTFRNVSGRINIFNTKLANSLNGFRLRT